MVIHSEHEILFLDWKWPYPAAHSGPDRNMNRMTLEPGYDTSIGPASPAFEKYTSVVSGLRRFPISISRCSGCGPIPYGEKLLICNLKGKKRR